MRQKTAFLFPRHLPPPRSSTPIFFGVQVTTAILYWDRDTDGAKRPISCATDGAANVEANATALENGRSRPSSAAFERWVEARPSVKSAISAVSSVRTLGMDDPELLHLQLEMESRRAPMSEAMLSRVCIIFSLVHYLFGYEVLITAVASLKLSVAGTRGEGMAVQVQGYFIQQSANNVLIARHLARVAAALFCASQVAGTPPLHNVGVRTSLSRH